MGGGPKMICIDWFVLAIQYCFAAHPSLPRSHKSLVKFKVATWSIAKGWWKISELTQPRTTSDTDATHGLLGEIEMKGLKKDFSVAYTFHPRLFSMENTFKRRVSRDFLFQVFPWIIFPQTPENNLRVISNFLQNFFEEIFTNQGAPPESLTPVANFPPVSMTPAVNLTNCTKGVSSIPVANFPWVSMGLPENLLRMSMTPVANNGNNIRLLIS